ncbi:MAG TPA: hypothetical protein VF517_03485 [Thermoleophilaceae bacterium]|jgi:hypothetical protein
MRGPIAAVLVLGALVLAAPAAAVTTTLGRLDPSSDPNSGSCAYVRALYIADDTPPNRDEDGYPGGWIPAGGGVITSWTTSKHPPGSRFRLAIVKRNNQLPETSHGVVAVAWSAIETVTVPDGRPQTFRTNLRVTGEERQYIALDAVEDDYIGDSCHYGTPFANFVYVAGEQTDSKGYTPFVTGDGYDHNRVNLEVTLDRGDNPPPQPPAGEASQPSGDPMPPAPTPSGSEASQPTPSDPGPSQPGPSGPATSQPAPGSPSADAAHERRIALKRHCRRLKSRLGARHPKARRACRRWHQARDAAARG